MGADGALWSIHAGVGGRRGVFFGRADLEFARGFPSRCLAPPYLGNARGEPWSPRIFQKKLCCRLEKASKQRQTGFSFQAHPEHQVPPVLASGSLEADMRDPDGFSLPSLRLTVNTALDLSEGFTKSRLLCLTLLAALLLLLCSGPALRCQ